MTSELYKKWRPKSFDEIVGQSEAVQALKEFIKSNRVPHALMLVGPSGCGKTTAARILRKRLKCSNLDYQEINASESRGIDTVREINAKMGLAPMGTGQTRVWVLDECQSLVSFAQQALLKLLEDTPDHVYFILCTTDPGKLLPTIRNRCTEMTFRKLDDDELGVVLTNVLGNEEKEIPQAVFDKIVQTANGSARKALVILNQVIGLNGEQEQLDAVLSADTERQAIDLARALIDQRTGWTDVAKILKELNDEPETVRRLILGYAQTTLLGGGKQAPRAYLIIICFEKAFYDSGKAGLAAACWEIISKK